MIIRLTGKSWNAFCALPVDAKEFRSYCKLPLVSSTGTLYMTNGHIIVRIGYNDQYDNNRFGLFTNWTGINKAFVKVFKDSIKSTNYVSYNTETTLLCVYDKTALCVEDENLEELALIKFNLREGTMCSVMAGNTFVKIAGVETSLGFDVPNIPGILDNLENVSAGCNVNPELVNVCMDLFDCAPTKKTVRQFVGTKAMTFENNANCLKMTRSDNLVQAVISEYKLK